MGPVSHLWSSFINGSTKKYYLLAFKKQTKVMECTTHRKTTR